MKKEFKRQAEYYRKLAAGESNPTVAQRMLDFAKHYEALAALMALVVPPSTSECLPSLRATRPRDIQSS